MFFACDSNQLAIWSFAYRPLIAQSAASTLLAEFALSTTGGSRPSSADDRQNWNRHRATVRGDQLQRNRHFFNGGNMDIVLLSTKRTADWDTKEKPFFLSDV